MIRMRVYFDHLLTRVLGTILGAGFVLIGLFAILASDDGISAFATERSVAFGITAIIAGVAAIVGSWAEKKLNEIWCAHPRRWLWRRSGRTPVA